MKNDYPQIIESIIVNESGKTKVMGVVTGVAQGNVTDASFMLVRMLFLITQ